MKLLFILLMQKAGIRVVVVGIGSHVDRRELQVLVDGPDDVIIARSFSELIPLLKGLTRMTCQAGMSFSDGSHGSSVP